MISVTSANSAARKPTFGGVPAKPVKTEAAKKASSKTSHPAIKSVTSTDHQTVEIKTEAAKKAPTKVNGTKRASTKPQPHDPKTTMKTPAEAVTAHVKKLASARHVTTVDLNKIDESKATVFTFIKMPPKEQKVPPQMLVVLEALKSLKSATMPKLVAELEGKLKTVQTPERIVTFYRKRMQLAGFIKSA